ncbi:MAG: glycosyl transferase family 1 [Litorilinea sp.]|uniref:Glycosyltransferase family 4 protein n=2 Tax=Litorilinea aerophila TaxID=1204385 RepID=A0A540VBM9_9CHLR|nr:MAG: glycosyl transferase family 1 [Litorilinea sp.]
MQIGIDASRAVRCRRTGTEQYARSVIDHLLALPQAAHHTWRLYLPPPQDGFTAPPPARWAAAEQRVLPGRRLWTHRSLAREIRQRRPDVLFVPSHVIPWLWPSRLLPAAVVTVHDLGYHYFPQAHPLFQRLYLQVSTRWNVRVASRVIAVSQATAQDLVRLYGVEPGRIRVIHEAPMPLPPASPAQQEAVRRRYGLVRPYALYVGTLQPRKNLARLVEAYARLWQQQPVPWDLVLAGGEGWLHRELQRLVERAGLAGHIHLTGYVPQAELPALLQGAYFFCFPSLFEGFGLPVLEAQSCGVPVMSANRSALPEIAGDAALYVDPMDVDAMAEAMLQLSQDEALRQRLIQAGYANVRRFSWEKAARETLAVLEEAASRG